MRVVRDGWIFVQRQSMDANMLAASTTDELDRKTFSIKGAFDLIHHYWVTISDIHHDLVVAPYMALCISSLLRFGSLLDFLESSFLLTPVFPSPVLGLP